MQRLYAWIRDLLTHLPGAFEDNVDIPALMALLQEIYRGVIDVDPTPEAYRKALEAVIREAPVVFRSNAAATFGVRLLALVLMSHG